MSLSSILIALRKEKEVAQEDIANYVGVSRSAYSHWELGKRMPSRESLEALADYYNVSMEFLLGKTIHDHEDVNLSRLMRFVREKLNITIDDLTNEGYFETAIRQLEDPAKAVDYNTFLDLCRRYRVDPYKIKSRANMYAEFSEIFNEEEPLGKLDEFDLSEFKIERELKIMTHKVPIYGAIPAGTPLEAIQDNIIDHIEVPSYLAQRKGLFALRIEGDSMNMIAGDGMVAVFESTDRLEDGELGAVYVNGYDATFKKFHRLNNMIILEPMSYNPAHEPIIIKDAEGVEVTAVGRLVTIAVPRDYVDRLK